MTPWMLEKTDARLCYVQALGLAVSLHAKRLTIADDSRTEGS